MKDITNKAVVRLFTEPKALNIYEFTEAIENILTLESTPPDGGVSDGDVLACAMAIVNHTNETVGTSVDERQKTNDHNFDFAIARVRALLTSRQPQTGSGVDEDDLAELVQKHFRDYPEPMPPAERAERVARAVRDLMAGREERAWEAGRMIDFGDPAKDFPCDKWKYPTFTAYKQSRKGQEGDKT